MRRLGLIAIAAVIALAAIYAGAWFYGAARVQDAAAAWIADRQATGMAARFDRLEVDGFPFVFRLTVEAPYFASPLLPGSRPGSGGRAWSWRSRRVVAELTPWHWHHVRIDLSGDHRIELGGAKPVTFDARSEELRVDLSLGDNLHPRSAAIDARSVTLDASRSDLDAKVARLAFHLSRSGAQTASHLKDTLSFGIDAEKVRLPTVLDPVLGNDLERLRVEGKLFGLIPHGAPADALAAWRDAGGTVELSEMKLRYGPMDVQANGTLALDDDLQPMGAMTADFAGFAETLSMLREAGLIRSRDATMARLVLGALARNTTADGAPAIRLPLSVQDRTLSVGPVPLLHFRKVAWPGRWPDL